MAYQLDDFKAYANLAWVRQRATGVVSNQFLFTPQELQYIASNCISRDHTQLLTGAGGVSCLGQGTKFSADLVYGGGSRNGFANTGTVNVFTPVNLGISYEFQNPEGKPLTLRFDVVNVFNQVYFLRGGTSFGVFAPQYGARRGFFGGVSQSSDRMPQEAVSRLEDVCFRECIAAARSSKQIGADSAKKRNVNRL